MRKITSFAVALGLMASIAASASAAEVTGTATVTGSTYSDMISTPIISQEDIKPATPQIILTKVTAFYFLPGGFRVAWLEPQTLDTTGQVFVDSKGNEWREIYTWLGKAWLKVPASALVKTP
ncbi:hypothetical protein PaeBR_20540 [Paenibacillus sp. BR2-3]|uniref:hypothetical protein n=1 Tax=Paenibacillus sp. BR2-3 TaxID=3048494 RepID=UPI0039779276